MSEPISVTLYSPHKNQQKIHDSIMFESFKYYVLVIGRQFGKTTLSENQVFEWFFNTHGCRIGWISPGYKQCKKVFKEMVKAFSGSEFVFDGLPNKSELVINGHNDSSINFYSAEAYESIRGETFDFLILDEFDSYPVEAWTEVLRATVLVRGKKVIFLGTPKGKKQLHKMSSLHLINKNYKTFVMTSYDNELIDPAEIDDAKATLPEHIFRQEYLAEFVDGGSGLFLNPIMVESSKKTNRMYAGLDIGRADDYTVLTIYNDAGEMCYIERWNHDTWNNIVSKVVVVINEYNCHTFVEVNGVGDPIFEQVRDKVTNSQLIQPFVTTSKSKQDIIEQLVVANQNKEVKFLNKDWLFQELDLFSYEYNPKSKSVRYSAPSGFHDDGVMSSAIGYEAYKTLSLRGVYSVR